MHGKAKGETPAGEKYRALDPVLLDWVAATAAHGFLMAYDRFVHPLSNVDKDRFMRDGDAIGREFGVRNAPVFVGAFMDMMAELEPGFGPRRGGIVTHSRDDGDPRRGGRSRAGVVQLDGRFAPDPDTRI